MKKLFNLLAALLLLSSNCFAQTVSFDWVKRFGSYKQDYGNTVCADDQGNVITIGKFRDTVDFDPGPAVYNLVAGTAQNVFISKHDASGNFIWAKMIAINDNFITPSATTDKQGNVIIVGTFRSEIDFDPGPGVRLLKPNLTFSVPTDGYILKLDSNGNFVWVCHLNSISKLGARAYCVKTDAERNVFVTGACSDSMKIVTSKDSVIFSPDKTVGVYYSGFLLKLDASGSLQFIKSSSGLVGNTGIGVDNEKNIWLNGYFEKTLDFDPSLTKFTMSSVDNSRDIYIVKLDSNANFVWAKQIGGKKGDAPTSHPCIDKWNNYYIAANFQDSVDFDPSLISKEFLYQYNKDGRAGGIVLSLDPNGAFRWVRKIGDNSLANVLDIDTFGNIYVGGSFADSVTLSPKLGGGTINLNSSANFDAFISMLDSKGNFVWAKQTLGAKYNNYTVLLGLSINSRGNIYATGYFQKCEFNLGGSDSQILTMLDTAVYESLGMSDIFLWKMTVSGLHSSDIKSKNPNLADYLKIYPNPATEIINIEGLSTGSTISLYNMLGQEVAKQTNNSNVAQISVRGMASGLYLVQIKDADGNVYNAKIIKE